MSWFLDLFRSRKTLKRQLANCETLRYLVEHTPGNEVEQQKVLSSLDKRITKIKNILRR